LLTILFVVLGVQVFYILKDFRVTLKHTNDILEDVENISKGISEPISSLSNMFGSASSLTMLAKVLSMFRKKKKD
jgi:hypothetical protein